MVSSPALNISMLTWSFSVAFPFFIFFSAASTLRRALNDYEKAFDSVQTQAILSSLQDQGIADAYIQLMKDIYTDSSKHQKRSATGGYHLNQTIHINTRKYLQKTELGEQRPENRRRIRTISVPQTISSYAQKHHKNQK